MANDPSSANADSTPDTNSQFVSKLKEGRQRFLAHAIEHGLGCGRRTPQDFIRHFPPTAIMQGLEYQPNLRANILVLTTGLKKKIALKKSWEDSATDLQIALDEDETDAESIVTLFDPDDRVRYLDPLEIWTFLTEGEFWKASSAKKSEAESARSHIAFMLDRALEDNLLTHRDLVEGVTVDELSARLPKSELGRLIQCALAIGEKGTPFTDADLLGTTPPSTLAQYIPLAHLWQNVIEPKIAERHGYLTKDGAQNFSANATPEAVATTPGAKGDASKRDAAKPDAAKPDAAKPDAAKNDAAKNDGAKNDGAKLPPPPVVQPGAGVKVAVAMASTPGKPRELASGVRKALREEEDITQEFEVVDDDVSIM